MDYESDASHETLKLVQYSLSRLEVARRIPDIESAFDHFSALDDTLKAFQKQKPNAELHLVYETLMLAAANLPHEHAVELMVVGLNIVARDQAQPSPALFDYVVQMLQRDREDFSIGVQPKSALTLLYACSEAVQEHPSLVTTDYTAMCCQFLCLPMQPYPERLDKYKERQPHLKRCWERETEKADKWNVVIEPLHRLAGESIKDIVRFYRKGLIYVKAFDLFSEDSLEALKLTGKVDRQTHFNERNARFIMLDCEALVRESRLSVKRLTYSPRNPRELRA